MAGLRGRSEAIGRFIIDGEPNQIGPGSVMVPGFVAACHELFSRFGSGRLRWAELLEPAIRLAADGFAVYPYIVSGWAKDDDGQGSSRPGYPTLRQKFAHDPAAAAIYMKPDGSGYAVGETLHQPAYAATLDQLARAGAQDFYEGAIGRAMGEDLSRRGSLVRPDDLAGYRIVEQQALRGAYRGDEILTTPPPSPGVQLLQMLAILELGWRSRGDGCHDLRGDARRLHRQSRHQGCAAGPSRGMGAARDGSGAAGCMGRPHQGRRPDRRQ
jgi:gamma-glutamyltranspeptidase/glutathione hydrolase